jgi:hypothetical protein
MKTYRVEIMTSFIFAEDLELAREVLYDNIANYVDVEEEEKELKDE